MSNNCLKNCSKSIKKCFDFTAWDLNVSSKPKSSPLQESQSLLNLHIQELNEKKNSKKLQTNKNFLLLLQTVAGQFWNVENFLKIKKFNFSSIFYPQNMKCNARIDINWRNIALKILLIGHFVLQLLIYRRKVIEIEEKSKKISSYKHPNRHQSTCDNF